MRQQTVIWTALPTGHTGVAGAGKLRLSVFVSPRLKTDEGLPRPVLSQFPDFLDWPARPIQFAVDFEGGPSLPATRTGPAPRLDLWQALFRPATYVRPFEFQDFSKRLIYSYPVRYVQGFIREQYRHAAKAWPGTYPKADQVLDPALPLGGFQCISFFAREPRGERDYAMARSPGWAESSTERALTEQLENVRKEYGAIPPFPSPNPPLDIIQAKLFHRPAAVTPGSLPPPDLDFHQGVSAVGDYPVLLRHLGLVHDLEVPWDAGAPSVGKIKIRPIPALNSPTQHFTPWTAYAVNQAGFWAQPRPKFAEIDHGLLRLGDPDRYTVVQTDVDGSAMKTLDFAANMGRRRLIQAKAAANLPPGLQVGPSGKTLPQPADRPDAGLPALRSAGLSLVRTGHAALMMAAFRESEQRNTQLEKGQDVTLFAEDLVQGYRVDVWESEYGRWYSLCRRAGEYEFIGAGLKLTGITDEGIVSLGATAPPNPADPRLYLHESILRWEGWSLVAPRPGKAIYPGDTVNTPQNDPGPEFKLKVTARPEARSLPRLRFGTVYRLRARTVDLAGNSAEAGSLDPDNFTNATQPVIYGRFEPVSSPVLLLTAATTDGETVDRLVIRSNDGGIITPSSERHVAPPAVSQSLAEQHGMFDSGGRPDPGVYNLITGRDGAFDPKGIYPEAQVKLPYLPDPMARGAAWRYLPEGKGDPVFSVNFAPPAGDTWPNAQPFRVRLVPGTGLAPGAPIVLSFDSHTRLMEIGVPAGETRVVRLSSHLNFDDLNQMGIVHWTRPDPGDAEWNKKAALGALWLLTPYREVTFVHAVQQPVLPPELLAVTPGRTAGAHFAALGGKIACHAASTGQADIMAEWEEPVDLPGEKVWRTISGRAHAFTIPIEPDANESAFVGGHHHFGDTKHRRVRYHAVGATRYAEYFQPGTAPLTRAGPPLGSSVSIPSSARPAAPEVLYVLPTFKWERKANLVPGPESRRIGGGLRVYVNRPWFSSGEGELLGVVLFKDEPVNAVGRNLRLQYNIKDAHRNFVTLWGMDPIWWPGTLPDIPERQDLKGTAKISPSTLSVPEAPPDLQVYAAGYEVHYDAERQLWYADIELDPHRAHFPFVRLALARYQPESVPGTELSPVVLADFAQLAPHRYVSLANIPGKPNAIKVTVTGDAGAEGGGPYIGRQGGGLRPAAVIPFARGYTYSYIEVTVEKSRPGVEGDLGWIPVEPGKTHQLSTGKDGNTWVWRGDVPLPGPRGAQPYRLVLREYEPLESGAGHGVAANQPLRRRMVFAETIEV